MSNIYKVLGITDNGDIRVKLVEALPVGCIERNSLQIGNKVVGQFWWDYFEDNALCGKYGPQFFMPAVYVKENDVYVSFLPEEDLMGDHPLDRFIWDDMAAPKEESDLNKILVEG